MEAEVSPKESVVILKEAVHLYYDLAHPNLIKIIEEYDYNQFYVVVFEWADGECLFDHWNFETYQRNITMKSPREKFISDMMLQIGYFILYGIMLALIGTLFVYIYLDLLFDMSLVFMFAYFSANLFLQDNYIFPAAFIVICTVMYGIIWRIRSAAL